MRLTWRERLVEIPELRDIKTWPQISLDQLSMSQQRQLLRNQSIIAEALAGVRFTEIAAHHNIHPSGVYKLLRRSLGGEAESDPTLTAALVPYTHVRSGLRRTPLSRLQSRRGGRGSFTELLNTVPNLRERLEKAIRNSVNGSRAGQNLTPKTFHAEFLRLLSDAQWPTDTYPYTELRRGYESLRRFLHERCAALRMPKPPSRTIRPLTPQLGAYQEIHIDEHTTDIHVSLHIEVEGQFIALRTARPTLILAVDVATDCYLAHSLCLTQHPTQNDMLALLRQLHAPWKPLELTTPGLSYMPGACFPSALGAPFTHAGVGVIRLDNALMHHSHAVRDYICECLGGTLSLGLPAHPLGRDRVEHGNDILGDALHRFRSTTGSSPQDPRREPRRHRNSPPVLTLRGLEEAISVVLTDHNIREQRRLLNRSPLEAIRQEMDEGFLPILSPSNIVDPFLESRVVPVCWLSNEKRAPHINFEGSRYHGACLCSPDLANKDIRVEFDVRDIRVMRAFRLTGEYLGDLRAPKSWQRFPHSLNTRKYINRLDAKDRALGGDPLGGYFSYLLARRAHERDALELGRVYREFWPNAPAPFYPDIEEIDLEVSRDPDRSTNIPPWSVNLSQGRSSP